MHVQQMLSQMWFSGKWLQAYITMKLLRYTTFISQMSNQIVFALVSTSTLVCALKKILIWFLESGHAKTWKGWKHYLAVILWLGIFKIQLRSYDDENLSAFLNQLPEVDLLIADYMAGVESMRLISAKVKDRDLIVWVNRVNIKFCYIKIFTGSKLNGC